MRILALCLLLTGCAGTQWADYNYGPGDWLAENMPSLTDGSGLEIATATNYEKLLSPEITVHTVDDLTEVCGQVTQGCAIGNAETCDIFIGERASEQVIEHEKRHCYGWDHTEDHMAMFKPWYPLNIAIKE